MQAVSGKKIAVTGGAGFLGSHLCEMLLAQGNEVICVDNFYTGTKQNIAHLLDYTGFEVVRHDVINPYNLEVDELYNLACAASPNHYQRYPVQTTRTCVQGAINALDLGQRLGIKVFQASTSEVYGNPNIHPQPEEYVGSVNPIGPRACYDEGKRCAETLFFDYWRESRGRLSIKVARIFNTYGPRMPINDGRAVSNFIVQALQGHDITIYGDGSQTRSFCFYTDTVQAFLRLMNTPAEITGPINIGNPVEITLLELADRIVALTGSASKIVHMPLPTDDPVKRKPDISKARALLNWEPVVGLEEGLKATVAHFDNMLSTDSVFARQIAT